MSQSSTLAIMKYEIEAVKLNKLFWYKLFLNKLLYKLFLNKLFWCCNAFELTTK